ncbi:histone deacetylase complex subunit Sap18-like protein [Babesia caballi]|uniref:Histone deacetylase complex subunit Sap18-like protein n=1 Tax=Babesia caballi TaxID=5871 RepID=A0AAV4LQ66_BABCB|nr:histone deacetylase complex subunit Sap18-like protein [Babesia caballi]
MRSISSSSRSMSVSRSFSNEVKPSESHQSKRRAEVAGSYSGSSSESPALSRTRRRQSDSRGSSSRSVSPPRRRRGRETGSRMSRSVSSSSARSRGRSISRSRRRRRRSLDSLSSYSRSYSSQSRSRSRSRSYSRSRRTRGHRGRRSMSVDSRSYRRRRSSSASSYSPPRRRDRGRHDERRDGRGEDRKFARESPREYRSRYEAGRRGWPLGNRQLRHVNRPPLRRPRPAVKEFAKADRGDRARKWAIDRTTHTPFLLRIYAFMDESAEAGCSPDEDHEAFQRRMEASESVEKLELYIWSDNTLRDLANLVKDLCEGSRSKDGTWTFQRNNASREIIGSIHACKWRRSRDSVTLRSVQFRVGESLLLFFRGVAASPAERAQTAAETAGKIDGGENAGEVF